MQNYYMGLSSIGLLPLDPVEIKEVSFLEDTKSGQNKPMRLNLWFKNWKMYGFKDVKFERIT